jgi:type VII secretion-associated serine protease mycosin
MEARRSRVAAALLVVVSVSAALLPAVPANADAIRDREYWLSDYGIRSAWNTTRGEGVTIAVIDTGIDGSHPDLAGAVSGGTDFSGEGAATGQKPVGSSDDSSHGTMVASLLAGRGNGASGIIGVAPEADVLSISIGVGDPDADSDQQIADAVLWAVDNGADVINMSLTRNTPDWPRSWDDAFLYAMENDVVVVAAAGNRGSGTKAVGAPATMPGVLTVAGVDRQEQASVNASSQGITIGVAAPSEELVGAVPGGGYVIWNGTSGATPLVAGVVALVRAAHPDLDAANVINRLTATATPAGAKGVDPIYGFGLINAARAVSASVPKTDENPMGDLADWVRLYRRADATPAPIATVNPQPVESGGDEPRAEEEPVASVFPSALALRNVGIPLALFLGFGGAAALLIYAARRHLGAVRRKE